jgi:branched-subunit amino acid ABC-type transport system permease component
MSDYLPLIIVGLSYGSVYALAGLGLVVTYTTSGIFNFAYGAVAAVGAYAFYELHVLHGWPWPVALLACLLVVGPLVGMALEVLARLLAPADASARIVASVGLLLMIRGLAIIRYGDTTTEFPNFLPTNGFEAFGVNVTADQVILCLVAAAAAAGLFLFFKGSKLGIATRGVVDNADLVGLAGTSPTTVRRFAWLIGTVFAVLAGILVATQVGLAATTLTLLVVQAFGGAAVGRFASLPRTYVGCLLIGVLANCATKVVVDVNIPGIDLQGVPASIPFIVLFLVLLVTPASKLVEETPALTTGTVARRLPPWATWLGAAVVAVLVLVAPALQPTSVPTFTSGLVHVVVFLALAILVRTSGQVSLCHVGLLAVGTAAFSHFAVGAGVPWLLAVLLAGMATVPVGLLIAVPAIRLSGLYLALATFGFGILLQRLVYSSSLMFGSAASIETPRPSFAQGDDSYYYVVATAVGVTCLAIYLMRRGRIGRLLRALSDSPTALATGGTNVNQTRMLVFGISAFLAGVAGALLGPITERVNSNSFDPFQSLIFLTVLAIAGRGEIRAAFVAAALLVVGPSYLDSDTLIQYLPVVFGTAAIVASVPWSSHTAVAGSARRPLAGRAQLRHHRSPVRARTLAWMASR